MKPAPPVTSACRAPAVASERLAMERFVISLWLLAPCVLAALCLPITVLPAPPQRLAPASPYRRGSRATGGVHVFDGPTDAQIGEARLHRHLGIEQIAAVHKDGEA